MANEGYEVYLIELTGGENSECDNCYDYTYEFLSDDVFPSYINYILNDSGSEKVKYVGHSNGARVALDSLTNGVVDSDNIDVLVLVGVPGAFSSSTPITILLTSLGTSGINNMDIGGMNHVTITNIFAYISNKKSSMNYIAQFTSNYIGSKISLNLLKQYYNWINNTNDSQPGQGLNVDYLTLIYSQGT